MIIVIIVRESKFAMIILIKEMKVFYEFKLGYDVQILNRFTSSSLYQELFWRFRNLHQGYIYFETYKKL